MTKQSKAREFARKQSEWWVATNAKELQEGRPAFSLEWMLGGAWKTGFDAGQNHQRKLQREKKT